MILCQKMLFHIEGNNERRKYIIDLKHKIKSRFGQCYMDTITIESVEA